MIENVIQIKNGQKTCVVVSVKNQQNTYAKKFVLNPSTCALEINWYLKRLLGIQ